MTLSIPLLLNHDPTKVIGFVREEHGRMILEFTDEKTPISRDALFAIFGNPGIRILETMWSPDGVSERVLRAEIVEFSLSTGK